MASRWHPDESQHIQKRIIVDGILTLKTPAHFGNGEQTGSELVLLQDTVTGNPLLPGASLAGALRHYLLQREHGYRSEHEAGIAQKLFGEALDQESGTHSRVIVNDAYGENAQIVHRDGVMIDGVTRTADDGALFTVQTWSEGTEFPIHFELIITADAQKADEENSLISSFATALQALAGGDIPMGARKNRGYGHCEVNQWQVRIYDMQNITDVVAWVTDGTRPTEVSVGDNLLNLLNGNLIDDAREFLRFKLSLRLQDSLLIRAGSDVAQMAHLSRSDDTLIVSGTSIAGALRARAQMIANTVNPDESDHLVDDLFGRHGKDGETSQLSASRVIVQEHNIMRNDVALKRDDKKDFVQNRVKIDRFTGGAFETALFDQEPVFAINDTRIKVVFEFRYGNNKDTRIASAQIGLLLLVLKDLWTQDLPLGGESNIGRGRLQGVEGTLCFNKGNSITLTPDGIDSNLHETLEHYIRQLHNYPKEV